jgi:hypothetical protein
LSGITSVSNFMKIYQAVQKLLVGTHRQTDRQSGDSISLLSFLDSKLKFADFHSLPRTSEIHKSGQINI